MLTKRMAMRRMNEMCRRMALTLVFYALLFHTCQGQDETTGAVSTHQSAIINYMSNRTFSGGPTDPSITNSTSSPEDNQVTDHPNSSSQDTLPLSTGFQRDTAVTDEHTPEMLANPESTTSQSVVHSTAQDYLSKSSEYHSVHHTERDDQIQQEASDRHAPSIPHDVKESVIHQTRPLSSIAPDAHSEQTQVFVPILVCGLILAAALIGGYVGRRRWCRKDSGMKLADESYMTDEDNQGNTLVSVAPLNPPESPEKPSQNGESLEAVKIQNPPAATNGHSTTKADTEL